MAPPYGDELFQLRVMILLLSHRTKRLVPCATDTLAGAPPSTSTSRGGGGGGGGGSGGPSGKYKSPGDVRQVGQGQGPGAG